MKINPTIGITGGSGYIGSSLASRLSKSFNIHLMDIKPPSKQFANNVIFHECDVRDYDAVREVVENVDLVIHTSIIQIPAINDQKKLAYEVNVLGTQNICKATCESKRAKGLILSGSWHTIGEKGLQGLINEEFGFRPDKVEARARFSERIEKLRCHRRAGGEQGGDGYPKAKSFGEQVRSIHGTGKRGPKTLSSPI